MENVKKLGYNQIKINDKNNTKLINKEGKIWSLRMWGETHQNISDIDVVRRQWLLFCCCFLISTYFLK